MSNRPFDDDDEFGFDDEFDFDADNELSTDEGDEFDFGDDDEFDFGDDDFDFGGDDQFDLPEEDAASRGPSRTFIYIAGAMIALFVIALLVLVFLSLGPQPPTEFERTSTAVAIANMTTEALLRQTQTQAVLFAQTQTQQVLLEAQTATAQAAIDLTASAQPTDTPTIPPTDTPDATQAAALALTAQAAIDLTASAQPTDTPEGPPTVAIDAVALTATALADLLQPTLVAENGGGGLATPTAEGVGPTPALPTALPDTGLFDDLAAGGTSSLGGLLLAVLGLIGVIAVSRRLRTANS